MKDMFGFIIILTFIIIGFALIFLEFQRDDVYGAQLYSTYQVLYGNVSDETFNVSQKLFAALILFLLNVVLLNLLISIMGDSYDKVQERRVLTDSLTRLEMILEAVVYMRIFKRGGVERKGYLIYCEPDVSELDENLESNEWDGRINLIKKALKQNDQKIDSSRDEMKEKMTSIEERLTLMEQQMRREMEAMDQKTSLMGKRMEEKLELVKQEMNTMGQEINKNLGEMMKTMNAHWS